MGVFPLNPEVVRETDAWFYQSHPRGRELAGAPLHPTAPEDAAGRRAWMAEYRRRLAQRQARSSPPPAAAATDPLDSCLGCCPLDFWVSTGHLPPFVETVEAEESLVLAATDIPGMPGYGTGAFTWTTTSDRLSLQGAANSPERVEGREVTIQAGPRPTLGPELGEWVEVTRTQPHCAPLTKRVNIVIQRCKDFRLARPRIIAVATDGYLTPTSTFADPALPGGHALGFGQDLTFATGRALPSGGPVSVGTTTADLVPKMRELLDEFASDDTDGKARRLFNAFLAPQSAVSFWSDPDLTSAARRHPNITTFVHRALNAPTSPQRNPGQVRIHQVLERAGWDINAAAMATGLGAPAFNRGSKVWGTEDFGNGLGVMINGIQHGIVVAKEYHYNRCTNEYFIKLEYVFYDVFGLDDDDLMEYGADGWGFDSDAAEGIAAWWQLQHQHGHAPLITRIAFEREFRVPVPPPGGAGP